MTLFRPNYRRARALSLEIEALKNSIEDARGDPKVSAEDLDEMKAELDHLQSEFFKTGVTSEYDL